MLTKVERSELTRCRQERSPLRLFADEVAREFLEVSHVGDVYEVTGAPDVGERGAARLAEALRSALYYLDRDMRKEVRVMTRNGSRVFLERLEKVESRKHVEHMTWTK